MSDKKESSNHLLKMRHSAAHVLATAVQKLWPEAKFGVGPVVDDGFYYDIDLGDDTLSEEDFSRIEKEMARIIKSNQEFKRQELPISDAIDWAKKKDQPYKLELLNDLKRSGTTAAKDIDSKELGLQSDEDSKVEKVSFYTNGDFTDLCRGPHVESTGEIAAFKLMRVAGAYWRGKEGNPQMQRVYGVAFATEKELRQHLHAVEEAKKRDHRKLGQDLDLFTISELVGSGLPLFTPNGAILRDSLADYSQELQARHGFQRVWTPHVAKDDLYRTSGHWDKFGEELFLVKSQETDDQLVMKPMNCPHHIQIFARKQWSYRELPVRYMENTTNYRDEKSGELHGLSRVRSLSQDDGHVFCKEDDLEAEITSIIRMVKDFYHSLGMDFYAHLSYRDDSPGYLGDKKLWQKAESLIKSAAEAEELKTVEDFGEAAFYGPKIDFMVKDSLNREWQCATIQIDFVQPERFDLKYIDSNGSEERPVIIHKALLGSIERFMSVYIEHTAGKFPVWLAPQQVRIITVNQEEDTLNFAQDVLDKAQSLGVRASLDNDNESVGKKIRRAETSKVPYTIVIGEKEMQSGKVVPRVRSDIEVAKTGEAHEVEKFFKTVANETKTRVQKTSV